MCSKPACAISNVSVNKAHDLIKQQSHLYLDVRTPEEFNSGHCPGAKNVPVMNKSMLGMSQNPNFLADLEKILPDKEAPVCVGCAAGARSMAAAKLMSEAGYSNIFNIEGGWNAWSATKDLPSTQ